MWLVIGVVAVIAVIVLALVLAGVIPGVQSSSSTALVTITSVHLVIEEQKTGAGVWALGPPSLNYTAAEGYPIQVAPGGTWSVVWPFINFDDVTHTVYNVTVSSLPSAPAGSAFRIAGTTPPLHYNVPAGEDDALLSISVAAPSDPGATFAVTVVVNASSPIPIGAAFSAGDPILGTCVAGSAQTVPIVAATIGGCNPADYIYTLTVESSLIGFSNALFEVKTPSGAIYTPGAGSAHDGFAILNIAQQVVAIAVIGGAMTMPSSFSNYGPTGECTGGACGPSTSLTSIYTIVIDMGTTATSGQGLSFVAVGTGGYYGTTGALSLP